MESINILELTDENINSELKLNDKLFLIDFWGESCVPCKRMEPMIKELASEYEKKMIFAKVNVNKNSETVNQFKIKSVPTFIFLKRAEVLEMFSGVVTKTKLKDIIETHL